MSNFDFRPVLLAALAWASVWLATSRDLHVAALVCCAGLLAMLLGTRRAKSAPCGQVSRRWLVVAAGAVILVSAGCAATRAWVQTLGPVCGWAAENATVQVTAVIGAGRSGVAKYGQWWQANATLTTALGRGERWDLNVPVRLVASGADTATWAQLDPGTAVSTTVRLSETDEPEANVAVARARGSPDVVALAGPVDAAVNALQDGLRASVAGLAPDARALVPALVVGDVAAMDEALRDDFSATGLTHLMAVSGANLTILLGCATLLVGRVWRGWRLRFALLGVVVFFALLCRGEPSVLRAAVMGGVSVTALGAGRRNGLRYLSWAVIALLLADPWLARSAGFALSVAATCGIVLWANQWAEAMPLPTWLAQAVCVPLAAQLATQPIITAISGQLSVVGVFANMIAAPLVAPATVMGFLATALAVLSVPVAALPANVAGWFAQGLVWIARWCAGLPVAAITWSSDPTSICLLSVAVVGVVAVLPRVWRSVGLTALLGIGMVIAVLQPVGRPGWPPDWDMVSCSVGQGDATAFNAGSERALLVDVGPDPKQLRRCLAGLGVHETVAVLTHLHADHVSGLPSAAASQVFVSQVREPASGWAIVTDSGLPVTVLNVGDRLSYGDVQVTVLAAKPLAASSSAAEGESSAENDSSLVMRVSVGDLTALLGGDVEEAGQRAAAQADLAADVALVPHHGSAHQYPGYLEKAHPAAALISVGENSYGHPAPSVLKLLSGTPVYRTDQCGDIAVSKRDGRLRITCPAAGSQGN
ncbi:MAG: ComEC/Rec2 family competence protein [Propionibacteriaceae bacterium]|jgi:competence protein ComEC|nr:ComEC/Rec2 family competence protein [Propionibacteriaceae bacterium]